MVEMKPILNQQQQQPSSSSSGIGSGSGSGSGSGGVITAAQQQTRTSPSSRSNIIRSPAKGSGIQSLDEAAEMLDEEGGYEGEDGDEDDDDEGGMTIGEHDSNTGDRGQELINETSVKSGYLYKRGEKRKNWKKRWFVLRSSKLYYYKNEKEYQLLRFIDMSEIHTIAPVQLKKIEHCFGISTSKRQYYVRATSSKEMQSWVEALRDVREQVRQRSTLTRDMALLDVGNLSSGGENVAATPNTVKGSQLVSSPTSKEPAMSPKSKPSGGSTGSQPISIVIPGKGLYTAPSQPRQTTGGTIISPLSATSDSDTGGPSGAEQFGLSYASSAGQSLASSPGRVGLYTHTNPAHHQQQQHQTDHYSSGGGNSPQTQSGNDEMVEQIRGKNFQRSSSGQREASVSSSVGEGQGAGSGFSMDRRNTNTQIANQVLSSSEEEGEGDDWDEEEEADLAMPLPDPTGLGMSSGLPHGHSSQQKQSQSAGSGSAGSSTNPSASVTPKPKVGPEFFKDSSKVIHQGYLMKQSSRRKQWRKRWFVLTSGSLSYTRSHMDAKAHRQIPLSQILDAIEYTSKKAGQQSGPLSPSLSAFGGNNPLANFGRSPLLGGSGDFGNGPERRGSQRQSSMATTNSNTGLAVSSDVEHGGLSAGEAESGTERRGSSVLSPPLGSGTEESKSRLTHLPSTKRKKENCFKIITPKRVYVVCAPTEEEELKWLSALQALLVHFHEKDAAKSEMITPKQQDNNNNDSLQEKQESEQPSSISSRNQSIITSPQQMVSSPPQINTTGSTNRLNPPSISLSKPARQGSQDDTPRSTNVTQEGLKAT